MSDAATTTSTNAPSGGHAGTGVRALTVGHVLALLGVVLVSGAVSFLASGFAESVELELPREAQELGKNLYVHAWTSGLAPKSAFLLLGVMGTFLAPGLLLALYFGVARTSATWLLAGFTISLLIVPGLSYGIERIASVGLAPYLASVGLALVAAAMLLLRIRRRADIPWPIQNGQDRFLAFGVIPAAALLGALIFPKLFWESFNGDGIHAFEATRLLLEAPLPFWPEGSGEVGTFPGVSDLLFTYPGAWYLRIFGEREVAIRAPFLLELAILFAGLVAVAAAARGKRLSTLGVLLMGIGVLSFAAVMTYSATYDPYCADMALPATQDTLLLLTFVGVVLTTIVGRPSATFLFAVLTLFGSSGGSVLLAAFGAGLLFARPFPTRRVLRYAAVAVLAVVTVALLPKVLALVGSHPPGGEHALRTMLSKYRYLLFFEWERFLWILVPLGFYPVLGLLRVTKTNWVGRALFITSALAFLAYYPLAHVSLHYFAPAMLLPLLAYFCDPEPALARFGGIGSALAIGLASLGLVLCLPTSSEIYQGTRDVGRALEIPARVGRHVDLSYLKRAELLTAAIPKDYDVTVPEKAFGGAPLAFAFYSGAGSAEKSSSASSAPCARIYASPAPRMDKPTILAENPAGALVVLDPLKLEQLKKSKPRNSLGRELFRIPRDLLFRRVERHAAFGVVDLKELLGLSP